MLIRLPMQQAEQRRVDGAFGDKRCSDKTNVYAALNYTQSHFHAKVVYNTDRRLNTQLYSHRLAHCHSKLTFVRAHNKGSLAPFFSNSQYLFLT